MTNLFTSYFKREDFPRQKLTAVKAKILQHYSYY